VIVAGKIVVAGGSRERTIGGVDITEAFVHAVTLVAGASSRTKVVDVAGADPAALDRLLGLL